MSIFNLADLSITEEYDLYVGEGPAFSFPQTGPTSSSGSFNWQQGYYLAFACREKYILESLVRKSTDIMRQRSEGVNEYSHLMVDVLKSFYGSYYESEDLIQETSTKLRAAINATDVDKIIPLTIDGTINFALPAMELVAALLEGNTQNFNESLADALECHKKYWSSDEQLSGDPRGFIAIAPLGLACAAYDAGFPIEVESDYIPKYILERQFLAQQKAS
jgi:Immunity protein 49